MTPIYLDYNATTPIDPAVRDAMLPYLEEQFGNPSSTHAYGRAAQDAVERAREQVAALIGAEPGEIVFTGGGSEANNLAIKGVCMPTARSVFEGRPPKARGFRWFRWQRYSWVPGRFTVVTTAIEHPATANAVQYLQNMGVRTHIIPVDQFGQVDPDRIRHALRRATGYPSDTLVTVMHSNNETGTLQPIAAIAAICREQRVVLHTDASQSLGKVAVNVAELGVDLLTIAGHKLYAPKGVGALYVRRGIRLEPLIHGASHEGGRRAGTENVVSIVGLGAACELARRSLPAMTERLRALRDRLHDRLRASLGERIALNGHPTERLPNTLNVNFIGHVGSDLLQSVPEIAASTGSACHEGRFAQSPVLCAMGVPPEAGQGAVRLSVGQFTTEAEVDRAADLLVAAAQRHGP